MTNQLHFLALNSLENLQNKKKIKKQVSILEISHDITEPVITCKYFVNKWNSFALLQHFKTLQVRKSPANRLLINI